MAAQAQLIFLVFMILPLLFCFASMVYLFWLTLAAMTMRDSVIAVKRSAIDDEDRGGTIEFANPGAQDRRFVILIPAHDEQLVIGAALSSLEHIDYPRDRFEIVVIADNCSDETAEIARSYGAFVFERYDQSEIGKGYALEWALNRIVTSANMGGVNREFDAVVVLDADTIVSSNLLHVFDRSLAAGERAIQARYDVLNPQESWRTRMMCCALALAHVVKPLGRERLRLSDGLKGNGMCFAREVVENIPWSGDSITEDIDYTLRLCRSGLRVCYTCEASIWAQMPTTAAQSSTQRKRWEGGRYALIKDAVPSLLSDGIKQRNFVLIDRAIDLIVPPFAEMIAVPTALMCLCAIAAILWHSPLAILFTVLWLCILCCQAVYLVVGLWIARVPIDIAYTALLAPIYIVWKLGLYFVMLTSRSAGGWKRTDRRKIEG